MKFTNYATLSCFILLLLHCAMGAEVDESLSERVMYEELVDGEVTINKFAPPPKRMNGAPILGDFNPSPRLRSCCPHMPGRSPVFGNCLRFLECDTNLTRRIVQCPRGLWFRSDLGECGPQDARKCYYGRLVPNPPQLSEDLEQDEKKQNSTLQCTKDGEFPLPGCRGFYSCRQQKNNSFLVYTYMCDEDSLWDGTACRPQEQVQCEVPEDGTSCLRKCVVGDTRVCRYTFIVEEFASMSIYCKQCPFLPEDCNLPSCVPAGGVAKPIITINRKIPGPIIQACKGDIIEVEVQNRLPEAGTTIHWHGLHQKSTPYMDGVPFITQCPIPSGNAFRYRMTADVSGTHLYHSHVGHQESDGMFGAMIIREPRSSEFGIDNRYDEDLPEHHMVIWHWFSRPAGMESIDTEYLSLRREGYSYLINGKGTVKKLFGPNGQQVHMPLETFHVKTGIRYRFRVSYNSALHCPIQLSVDNHMMDILTSDGRPLMNQTSFVDSVFMTAGERMDFVVHAKAAISTVGQSFFIRVRGLNDCDDRKNSAFQTAILRYDNSIINPVSSMSYGSSIRSGVGFNLNADLFNVNNYYIQARPLTFAQGADLVVDSTLSGIPNRTFYIKVAFELYTDTEGVQVVFPQLNKISWKHPYSPPLTQPNTVTDQTFCRPDKPLNCRNGLCRCPQMLEMNNGDLVEIILVDERAIPVDIGHPFHLHGFAFRVVAMEQAKTDISVKAIQQRNEANLIEKRFDGPLKDTVVVPTPGFTVIRFIANNPGYWFLHCHVSTHMVRGMALVLKVGNHSEMVTAPKKFPTCGNFY